MYTISNKAKVLPPLSANEIRSRYQWLSLEMAEPNLGVPKGELYTGSNTFLLSSDLQGNRGWASASTLSITFSSEERPDVPTINDAINELFYKYPTVRIFLLDLSASPRFVEFGRQLGNGTTEFATLSWASVKENGRAIITWYLNLSGLNATTQQWLTGDWSFDNYRLGFVSGGLFETKSYYLTAEDWASNRGEATYNVTFLPPTYYGVTTANLASIDGPAILASSPRIELTNRLEGIINFNTTGGRRFYVAVPVGAQIPTFSVGPFEVILDTKTDVAIQSPNTGITHNYTILLSIPYQTPQTVTLT